MLSETDLFPLQGRLTGLGGEDLPTVVIVAHYDSFGVAPVSILSSCSSLFLSVCSCLFSHVASAFVFFLSLKDAGAVVSRAWLRAILKVVLVRENKCRVVTLSLSHFIPAVAVTWC